MSWVSSPTPLLLTIAVLVVGGHPIIWLFYWGVVCWSLSHCYVLFQQGYISPGPRCDPPVSGSTILSSSIHLNLVLAGKSHQLLSFCIRSPFSWYAIPLADLQALYILSGGGKMLGHVSLELVGFDPSLINLWSFLAPSGLKIPATVSTWMYIHTLLIILIFIRFMLDLRKLSIMKVSLCYRAFGFSVIVNGALQLARNPLMDIRYLENWGGLTFMSLLYTIPAHLCSQLASIGNIFPLVIPACTCLSICITVITPFVV